jgi:hypothetical protein
MDVASAARDTFGGLVFHRDARRSDGQEPLGAAPTNALALEAALRLDMLATRI